MIIFFIHHGQSESLKPSELEDLKQEIEDKILHKLAETDEVRAINSKLMRW